MRYDSLFRGGGGALGGGGVGEVGGVMGGRGSLNKSSLLLIHSKLKKMTMSVKVHNYIICRFRIDTLSSISI